MKILHTERLTLREFTLDDAAFILELLNDTDFIKYVGDRGVRTLKNAREYLQNGPLDSYRKHGHGLYMVEIRSDGTAIGTCGLLKREGLDDVDIGFAFLPPFRQKGYAFESAAAMLEFSKTYLKKKRIVAIVQSDNTGSIRILEKLGMRFEKMIKLPGDEEEIQLYSINF